MIEPQTLQNLLLNAFPGATLTVTDLTGTKDHYKVVVVSDKFDSLSRVKRQQLVNSALAEPLLGPLHALTMETLTPQEAQTQLQNSQPQQIKF